MSPAAGRLATPRSPRSLLDRLRDATQHAADAVAVTALLGLTFAVLWQIAARFVFAARGSASEELARYLLVWLGLFGGAAALGPRLHSVIELWQPTASRRALASIVVATSVVLVFEVGGYLLIRTVAQLGQRSAAAGLPMGWVYAALPLSGALLLALCLTPSHDSSRGPERR